jgi:hypothetical protein
MAQQSGDSSNSASFSSEVTNYSLSEMAMKLLSRRKLIVASNRGCSTWLKISHGKPLLNATHLDLQKCLSSFLTCQFRGFLAQWVQTIATLPKLDQITMV